MNKDAVYEFLQNINREIFADLLKTSDYESDNLDFKETWEKRGVSKGTFGNGQ